MLERKRSSLGGCSASSSLDKMPCLLPCFSSISRLPSLTPKPEPDLFSKLPYSCRIFSVLIGPWLLCSSCPPRNARPRTSLPGPVRKAEQGQRQWWRGQKRTPRIYEAQLSPGFESYKLISQCRERAATLTSSFSFVIDTRWSFPTPLQKVYSRPKALWGALHSELRASTATSGHAWALSSRPTRISPVTDIERATRRLQKRWLSTSNVSLPQFSTNFNMRVQLLMISKISNSSCNRNSGLLEENERSATQLWYTSFISVRSCGRTTDTNTKNQILEIQLHAFISARVGKYFESTCRAGPDRGLHYRVYTAPMH